MQTPFLFGLKSFRWTNIWYIHVIRLITSDDDDTEIRINQVLTRSENLQAEKSSTPIWGFYTNKCPPAPTSVLPHRKGRVGEKKKKKTMKDLLNQLGDKTDYFKPIGFPTYKQNSPQELTFWKHLGHYTF